MKNVSDFCDHAEVEYEVVELKEFPLGVVGFEQSIWLGIGEKTQSVCWAEGFTRVVQIS